MASVSHVVPFHIIFEMSTNMLCCDQSYLFLHMLLLRHGVLIKSSNFVSDHSDLGSTCYLHISLSGTTTATLPYAVFVRLTQF